MHRKISWLLLCTLVAFYGATVPVAVPAAGRVQSVTKWVTDNTQGNSIKYKDEYEEFDRFGNRILFINYRKDGSIKVKEKHTYDKFGNRIERILFEDKKAESARESYEHLTYKYNAYKVKIEECEYNKEGKLKTRTLYTYNSNGKRTLEEVFDGAGKLKMKEVISYDKLKNVVMKVSVNSNGDTTRVQKYAYTYF